VHSEAAYTTTAAAGKSFAPGMVVVVASITFTVAPAPKFFVTS
jgi:hypothetical protein